MRVYVCVRTRACTLVCVLVAMVAVMGLFQAEKEQTPAYVEMRILLNISPFSNRILPTYTSCFGSEN